MKITPRFRQQGFSMIEVLITIVVVSIALLGVAKMQAASISNTQLARVQSLVALQADSLAALMHSNAGSTGYWSATAPTSFTASGTTISNATLNAGGSCIYSTSFTSACSASQLAAADMAVWVASINAQIPTYGLTVTCVPTATPVTCSINITWIEKYTSINTTQANAAATTNSAATATQSYTLLVTP